MKTRILCFHILNIKGLGFRIKYYILWTTDLFHKYSDPANTTHMFHYIACG